MSSTPLTCCSIGAATDSATTVASAPGYWHMTWIVGGVICGYWARGNVNTETSPASVMTIDKTLAKIGRSMKKRENKSATSSGRDLVGSAVRTETSEHGPHSGPYGMPSGGTP